MLRLWRTPKQPGHQRCPDPADSHLMRFPDGRVRQRCARARHDTTFHIGYRLLSKFGADTGFHKRQHHVVPDFTLVQRQFDKDRRTSSCRFGTGAVCLAGGRTQSVRTTDGPAGWRIVESGYEVHQSGFSGARRTHHSTISPGSTSAEMSFSTSTESLYRKPTRSNVTRPVIAGMRAAARTEATSLVRCDVMYPRR